jgi:hypothetical protein
MIIDITNPVVLDVVVVVDKRSSLVFQISAQLAALTLCGHIDKCEDQHAKDEVAVYCVTFTTEPEAHCYKPPAPLKGTTLVHVRHDMNGKMLGMLVLRPGTSDFQKLKV